MHSTFYFSHLSQSGEIRLARGGRPPPPPPPSPSPSPLLLFPTGKKNETSSLAWEKVVPLRKIFPLSLRFRHPNGQRTHRNDCGGPTEVRLFSDFPDNGVFFDPVSESASCCVSGRIAALTDFQVLRTPVNHPAAGQSARGTGEPA